MLKMNMNEEEIFIEVLKANAITRKMDIPGFMTFYCMIAEDFCRDNDLDIRDFIDEIHATVYAINDEFGKF